MPLQSAGKRLQNVDLVAGHLGLHSNVTVANFLSNGERRSQRKKSSYWRTFLRGKIVPNSDDPFPVLSLSPILEDCKGVFLYCKDVTLIGLEPACGKEMYKMCVKVLNKMFLNNRVDTPWRSILQLEEGEHPEWKALYKSPLTKKFGDLQWRILHGAIAVNAFISVLNLDVGHELSFLSAERNCISCIYAMF